MLRVHADYGDAEDDDLAGFDIAQEQITNLDQSNTDAGSEDEGHEDGADDDAGAPHPPTHHRTTPGSTNQYLPSHGDFLRLQICM